MAAQRESTTRLSTADVERLISDPSPEARATTVAKVAFSYGTYPLSPRERQIAEEIFGVCARDAAVAVRQALSHSIRHLDSLPHDVAVKLANDIDLVAIPMIEASAVLTDDDLVTIVRRDGVEKQAAVARREAVSEPVSAALVETRQELVVATLMANDGARISEDTLNRAIDLFADSERVTTPMVQRRRLPLSVAVRLVGLVSDRLKEHLVTHHQLPDDVAADLVIQTRERATANLISQGRASLDRPMDIETLVRQLHENGALTTTLILRAICVGDIAFIEQALAQMSGVPITNTRILLHDSGPMGLRSLCSKAGLPEAVYRAIRIAFEVARELERDGLAQDQARFCRVMLERVLTRFDAASAELVGDEMEYLLRKLEYYANQVPA